MHSSKDLKRSFFAAILALLIAFAAAATATFAWYLYNSKGHTTNVHMAAGTTASLEIANTYEGPYATSTQLSTFDGLLNPVSTNDIRKGFRKVMGFTKGADYRLLARWFENAAWEDYFTTRLFLRTKGGPLDLYLSGINYDDENSQFPISTAIRVGLLVHEPGENQPVAGQYIFAINDSQHIETPEYNTYDGSEGYVLDLNSSDLDAVVPFTPYTSANYCEYDQNASTVTLLPDSLKLCTLPNESFTQGKPVEIEVYIWLEGCDQDCTLDISGTSLTDMALRFAGKEPA